MTRLLRPAFYTQACTRSPRNDVGALKHSSINRFTLHLVPFTLYLFMGQGRSRGLPKGGSGGYGEWLNTIP
jgi:hypothetical protein